MQTILKTTEARSEIKRAKHSGKAKGKQWEGEKIWGGCEGGKGAGERDSPTHHPPKSVNRAQNLPHTTLFWCRIPRPHPPIAPTQRCEDLFFELSDFDNSLCLDPFIPKKHLQSCQLTDVVVERHYHEGKKRENNHQTDNLLHRALLREKIPQNRGCREES